MKRRKKLLFRNRNQTGWWIASYVERFEYYDEDKRKLNRRCLAWENTILVQAGGREEAYRKAMAFGRIGDGSEGHDSQTRRRGAWRFEGLRSLLPICEKLEDGAEILWREYQGRTVKKVKSLVKAKKELEAFDDDAGPEAVRRRFNKASQPPGQKARRG